MASMWDEPTASMWDELTAVAKVALTVASGVDLTGSISVGGLALSTGEWMVLQ